VAVPHHPAPEPRPRGAPFRPRRGEEASILRQDLQRLTRWMFSLEQIVVDVPRTPAAGDFSPLRLPARGMAARNLSLWAEWPVWSKKPARAAGLVCAQCDYDLREFKDENRLPFDVRHLERPHSGGWCAVSAATMAPTR
jgi:hypothetical protein